MTEILQGIVIGVCSGLILSLAFWANRRIERLIERRNQIRYLARVIASYRDKIYGAEILEVPMGGTNQQFSRDAVRKAYFDDMRSQVESILQGRASRLSYDEIDEIGGVFQHTDANPTIALNDKGYGKVFGQTSRPVGGSNYRQERPDSLVA